MFTPYAKHYGLNFSRRDIFPNPENKKNSIVTKGALLKAIDDINSFLEKGKNDPSMEALVLKLVISMNSNLSSSLDVIQKLKANW